MAAERGRGGAGGRAALRAMRLCVAAALLALGAALPLRDQLLVRGEPLLRATPEAGVAQAEAADAAITVAQLSPAAEQPAQDEPAVASLPAPEPLLDAARADGHFGADTVHDAASVAEPWNDVDDEADSSSIGDALTWPSDHPAADVADGTEAQPRSVATEDDQLVGTGWGVGSWSTERNRLNHKPWQAADAEPTQTERWARMRWPNAAPGALLVRAHAEDDEAEGLSLGMRDARQRAHAHPRPHAAPVLVAGMADATPGGDNAAAARAVLRRLSPAAAALAGQPGVGGVRVSVDVAQDVNVAPRDGGGLSMRHTWTVSTAADVAPLSEDAASLQQQPAQWRIAAGLMRLRHAAAPLATPQGAADGAAQLSAQLRAERLLFDRAAAADPRASDAQLLSLFQAPGRMDGSEALLARALAQGGPPESSFLGETPMERAAACTVLAVLWLFLGVLIGRCVYEHHAEEEEDEAYVFVTDATSAPQAPGTPPKAEKERCDMAQQCGIDEEHRVCDAGKKRAASDGLGDYTAMPYSVA